MIQQAHNAYNAQEYEKAFKLYEALAENGDATAMTVYGTDMSIHIALGTFVSQKDTQCKKKE